MSTELEPIIADDVVWGKTYYEKQQVDEVIAKKDHMLEYARALTLADINGIAELKDALRWRQFSEEKPQDGQEVWAYDSCQKLVIKLEYKVGESDEGFIGFPLIHGFWPCITHWMPYNKPKAPEDFI